MKSNEKLEGQEWNIYIPVLPNILMVYITKKKIKGHTYLYLEESIRINGKRQRAWQKYLGPEDSLKDLKIRNIFSKHSNDIRTESLEFGVSAALSRIANKIELARIIDERTDKSRNQGLTVGEYITIAAINRCAAPCSKSRLPRWFEKDWLSSRYDIDPEILNAQTYWNHFQYLSEEKINDIELALNKTVLKEFDLSLDCLFYDPTNFFTYSRKKSKDGLLQFGHSKENRNGNRLVSYTLLCARESGIPLMHYSYAGNVNDARLFKQMPSKIERRLKKLGQDPKSVTLVFDKGNHSQEAFKAIHESGYGFIASIRNSMNKKLLQVPEEKYTETTLPSTGKVVKYYKTSKILYGMERDVYLVLDPKKYKKHAIAFNEKLDEKVENIRAYFKDRLNVKKWRQQAAVEKKMAKMIGRNPYKKCLGFKVSGSFGNLSFQVRIDENERRRHLNTLGKSVLFTNNRGWSPESIIMGYREQYIVEHAFRKMKSPTSITIRPMFHSSDSCIRAHVFLCVLAYLLISLLRLDLARNSFSISHERLLEELGSIHVLKIKLSPKGKPLWKMDTTCGLARKLVKKLKLKQLIN